ncbi:MAG: hypothetical protein KDC44_11395 [Phaeodactylibacter sp.]|nr:hypothetical protein [Phaeodactylibacter sp.]
MSQHIETAVAVNRVRPRFQIEVPFAIEEVVDRLKSALDQEDAPCKGRIYPGYATMRPPFKDQHYWSPQLTLSMEETEEGTLLRGLYGPRSEVWTMFVFFYGIIAFAIMIIGIIGFSNMSLGESGAILWLLPVLVLLFLTLYLVAYFGKKMGNDQILLLHGFVEQCIGLTIR